ncbi:MAG: signal recognition particle receptor subunit alpha, partial [Christensenellales bacterium]
MAFEGLSEKLQGVFKKLTGRGKLNEKDIKEAMREVKLALLEADVNFLVVKSFIKTVSDRCVGAEVLESLTPGQQVIKIVNEELTALMGGGQTKLTFSPKPPTIIMLVGLQGAGKTTMCGKLGAYLKKQYGRSPLLVGCDIYRPAAIKQLQVVGEKLDLPVFERGQSDPVETALLSLKEAERRACDLIIVDTAGRLHIDEEMMDEIVRLKQALNPTEILLTVDAMTGQDAVNVAK